MRSRESWCERISASLYLLGMVPERAWFHPDDAERIASMWTTLCELPREWGRSLSLSIVESPGGCDGAPQ